MNRGPDQQSPAPCTVVMMSSPSAEPDFSVRLHELRGIELQRLRGDARTVLHGGAAAAWYFRWFEENYPGIVERHIGVEAFQERPVDLPANVEWLRRTLGDMGPVPTGSVDLVFGGQVVEHLWPDDVADFLAESHRVLRPGGTLVLDSPNRRVTEAIAWHHPQHTLEFSIDEITQLTTLAGFELEDVRGVVLGYDRVLHSFLGLDDERVPWQERARLAADRPEDSFVWWLVAKRADRKPDAATLRELTHRQAADFRARRLRQLTSPLPIHRVTDSVAHVSAPGDYAGPLLLGPNFPLDAGEWHASFALRSAGGPSDPKSPVARVAVASDSSAVPHAHRDVFAGDLDPGGAWTTIDLDFNLTEMIMGLDVQAFAHGQAPIGAQMVVDLRRREDVALTHRYVRERSPSHAPEPRTVEIIAMLSRRAVSKAKAKAKAAAALRAQSLRSDSTRR